MTITVAGVEHVEGRSSSGAAGNGAGGVTSPITPGMPSGVANGDRVYVVQVCHQTNSSTPTNWNAVCSGVTVGSGTAASSAGVRAMSIFYRDKDAGWSSMPSFAITGTNPAHWLGVMAVRPTSGATFNTPTVSTAGIDTGGTAYSATTGSLTTTANGLLIAATGRANGAATANPMTSEALSQSGATLGSLTQEMEGWTTLGNDVAGMVHTCLVTAGAAAALTFTGTLPGAGSTGGTVVVQQTETAPPAGNTGAFFAMF